METTYGNNVKKYFLLPEQLAAKIDEIRGELGLNFSEILRRALENYVDKIEKEKIDKEIAEACKFYFETDKKIAAEWRPAEGDI